MAYQNFYATRLATDIGAGDTTITLETAPTATAGRMVLEARNPTQREVIKYTGLAGSQITGVLRGQGGTTAKQHTKNSLVEMNVTAEDLTDAINVPNTIVERFDEAFDDYVVSGLVWSVVSGRNCTMTAGTVYINGVRVPVSAVASRTFTATKHTWVDIGVDGVLDYNEVTVGSAPPALAASHVRLAFVVTDASNATVYIKGQYANTGVVRLCGTDTLGNIIYPNSPRQLTRLNVQVDTVTTNGGTGGLDVVHNNWAGTNMYGMKLVPNRLYEVILSQRFASATSGMEVQNYLFLASSSGAAIMTGAQIGLCQHHTIYAGQDDSYVDRFVFMVATAGTYYMTVSTRHVNGMNWNNTAGIPASMTVRELAQ